MASILSAGTTSATAMVHTADTSGVLQLASNNGVVGLTLDTSQRVLLSTTAAGTSLVQSSQAGINATSLTTTTVLNLGQKMSFTGVTNTDGYIFGGIAMGGLGEEYAGIAAYDNGSAAATGLKFFTGTTGGIVNAMTINSTGYITQPSQPAFEAYTSSSSARFNAGDTIIFDAALTNVSSSYNASNGRFTAPVAGVYHIHYQIYSSAINTSVKLLKNGADYNDTFWVYVASSGVTGTVQTTISLAAGDYISVGVHAGQVSGDYCNFGGFLQS